MRARPRPKKTAVNSSENPFTSASPTPLLAKPGEKPLTTDEVPNPFADLVGDTENTEKKQEMTSSENNETSNALKGRLISYNFEFLFD